MEQPRRSDEASFEEDLIESSTNERTVQESDYDPPQGRLETLLAGWWREALGVEQVGRDDDFFELGGSSLLAMQLSATATRELGVRLPFMLVYRNPTVRKLGLVLRNLTASSG